MNQVRLPFKEKNIVLELNLSETLPPMLGDEQQISWVILNLLNNALQFTQSGGRVEVSTFLVENQIHVQVRDTGKGIPEESLEKIFNKFVQVKHPNDPTPGSVGLGLSIAKDIVEMYGGKIWVESELEKGSTFTFQLPVQQGMTT
jgi:signal transduction histidine kinase